MAKATKSQEGLGCTVAFVGLLSILGGFGVTIYQAIVWLKDAIWPPIPFWAFWYWLGLSDPNIELLGLQKILLGILYSPLSAVLFIFGVAAIGFFILASSLTND